MQVFNLFEPLDLCIISITLLVGVPVGIPCYAIGLKIC